MKKLFIGALSVYISAVLFVFTAAGAETDNAEVNEVNIEEAAAETVVTEEENQETVLPPIITSDNISFSVHIEDAANLIPQNMVFGIYSPQGQFWGAQRIWVADVAADHTITFNVPEYRLGETLYLKLFSGAEKVQYGYDFYGVEDMIPIQTFVYFSEEEGRTVYGNEFSISATPLSSRYVKGFANGWELYFKNPAKLINGVTMIPMYEYLDALFMSGCAQVDNASGRIQIDANGHSVLFFLNGNDMYADGAVTYSDVVPQRINGVIYVPFRFLVEGLGGTISSWEENGVFNVYADLWYEDQTPAEEFVNSNGIKSSTDYLVWISKGDYTVTVFLDKNGVWDEIKSFPCSIGAPGTPTITGQYEYYSRESRWSYPNYYVGPIMRFYNGYAIHSTLLRYDGSDYDGRVGKQISHGCVRVEPENINWMVNMVPLYTKIYITN